MEALTPGTTFVRTCRGGTDYAVVIRTETDSSGTYVFFTVIYDDNTGAYPAVHHWDAEMFLGDFRPVRTRVVSTLL